MKLLGKLFTRNVIKGKILEFLEDNNKISLKRSFVPDRDLSTKS